MKSSGGNYSAPNSPAPPANLINPQGQTARATPYPQQQSFLPSDPTAMATGLTPEMMTAIETPPPPPVQQVAAAAPASSDQKRLGLAELMLLMMGRSGRNATGGFGSYGSSGGGGGIGGGYSTSGRGGSFGGSGSSARSGGLK